MFNKFSLINTIFLFTQDYLSPSLSLSHTHTHTHTHTFEYPGDILKTRSLWKYLQISSYFGVKCKYMLDLHANGRLWRICPGLTNLKLEFIIASLSAASFVHWICHGLSKRSPCKRFSSSKTGVKNMSIVDGRVAACMIGGKNWKTWSDECLWAALNWKVVFSGCFQMNFLSPPERPARRRSVNAAPWRWTREGNGGLRKHRPSRCPHGRSCL